MKRLMEYTVRSALVMAWRLATWPTRRSLFLAKATMEGVVRWPSAFGITVGLPPSMTATQELVVPKSMPMILPMRLPFQKLFRGPGLGLRLTRRYDDFCVLENLVLGLVAFLQNLRDVVLGNRVARLL